MEVEVIFKDSSTPKRMEVDGMYTKGGFCVFRIGDFLLKYPMENIFSVGHKAHQTLMKKISEAIHKGA